MLSLPPVTSLAAGPYVEIMATDFLHVQNVTIDLKKFSGA
jgi:hypothetical protein